MLWWKKNGLTFKYPSKFLLIQYNGLCPSVCVSISILDTIWRQNSRCFYQYIFQTVSKCLNIRILCQDCRIFVNVYLNPYLLKYMIQLITRQNLNLISLFSVSLKRKEITIRFKFFSVSLDFLLFPKASFTLTRLPMASFFFQWVPFAPRMTLDPMSFWNGA